MEPSNSSSICPPGILRVRELDAEVMMSDSSWVSWGENSMQSGCSSLEEREGACTRGWACSLVVECAFSMHQAVATINTYTHTQDLANTCPNVCAPPKTLKLLARNSEGSKKVPRASSRHACSQEVTHHHSNPRVQMGIREASGGDSDNSTKPRIPKQTGSKRLANKESRAQL